jgi:hypothetical protein
MQTRRWLTGMGAPVLALLMLLAADRAFHRHRRAPPRAACAGPDFGRARPAPLTMDDVRQNITMMCSGPEAPEDCAPSMFAETFARELPVIAENRKELEREWLGELASGGSAPALGLAYLDSRLALPVLRQLLLRERGFYGRETSIPDAPDVVFADDQYPRQRALIAAIEHISRRPLRAAVRLTDADRHRLRRDAAGCAGAEAARWLLNKLDGAPLPTRTELAVARRACAVAPD